MRVETLHYEDSAWSRDLPALDSARTLVLVFGAPAYLDRPEPIAQLAAAYPRARIVGCSSAGEIDGPRVRDDSLTVAVARFEHTDLDVSAAAVPAPEQSFDAGRAVARALQREGLAAVLVLSDGLRVNGSELARGVASAVGPEVVVTGGLAGDGSRFERTWVLHENAPRAGIVSAVGLYGRRLEVGHGSRGGWDKFGPERRVTRAAGNVLYELDGTPALALYQRYLGERANELPAAGLRFPLALRARADDEPVVRTILGVDVAAGSLTFAGDVPEGHLAQLMRANFDRLVTAAGDAALMTRADDAPGRSPLVVAISCIGRRLVLGERVEEELEAALDALPRGARQVGFYSYGELSPHTSGRCELHNQTMTLTTFDEA